MLLHETELPTPDRFQRSYAADQAAAVREKELATRLWDTSRNLALYRDNANAEDAATAEAYDRRNRAIFEATGVQLDNPRRQFAARDAQEASRILDAGGDPLAVLSRLETEWSDKVKALARERPELADRIGADRPIRADALAITRGAEAEADAASAAAGELGTLRRFGNMIGGGIAGALRDPVQVGTLFLGGGSGAAQTALGRIVQTVLTEAMVNGGVEAAVQAASQDYRREAGVESGLMPALTQVGLAAGFGGGLGGLVQGGREVFRALGRAAPEGALQRVAAGRPEPGDAQAIADAAGVPLSGDDLRVSQIAAEQDALDRAAFGEPPADMAPAEASRAMAQTVRAAEADIAPAPAPPQARPAIGGPANFQFFDPASLEVDAARFQFKAGGDEAGVTERLRGVKEWQPERAGVVVVFEQADGRRFVADGHQRTGLARRIAAETGQAIEVPGYVFREADGYTAESVRTIAALKNIAEGSGSAIDAAKVLRSSGEAGIANLPPSSALVRDAGGLSRLSDQAFQMAVNEVVKPQIAAVVGRLVANDRIHAEMLDVLKKQGATTIGDAESMVRDMLEAATTREVQVSLFGDEEIERMLLKERAKVRAAALNALKKDKAVFSMLAAEEARVSAAGNVLDTAANAGRAQDDNLLIEVIERLSQRAGPIGDAFNAAARAVAGGERPAGAARAFVDAVRDGIRQAGGDLGRIGARGPEARGAQLGSAAPEPATPEAAEQAANILTEAQSEATDAGEQMLFAGVAPVSTRDRLEAQAGKPLEGGTAPMPEGGLFDLEGQKQMDIWDAMPGGTDAEGKPRHFTHETLVDDADRDAFLGDLVKSCKD